MLDKSKLKKFDRENDLVNLHLNTTVWLEYLYKELEDDDSRYNVLTLSMEKWKLISLGYPLDISGDSCPLCIKEHNVCSLCPVMCHTGMETCIGTPFDMCIAVKHDIKRDGYSDAKMETFYEVARKEYDFLKKLRSQDDDDD